MWTGSPAVGRGLHELAERQGADLVVVGSSGRGLLGRVAVGDHTRDALNGAPCAVAVAPAGYAQRPSAVRKIGVGYDGSPESKHALAVARELAAWLGAKVSAFEAVTLPLDAGNVGALDQLVESARSAIAELGDVDAHAAYGDPVEELALFGASVDLLIVGSRGYGPIGRLVHGSTSQRLVRSARCPVWSSREPPLAREPGTEETGRPLGRPRPIGARIRAAEDVVPDPQPNAEKRTPGGQRVRSGVPSTERMR